MDKYQKVYVYTLAGVCGIAGFAVTYVTLDWLFQPIENWIDKKFH